MLFSSKTVLCWLRAHTLFRLLKNGGVLLSGNAIASLIGLASFALTARTLGTDRFGALVLVHSYALIIDRLVNFQSWQALIKYGADSITKHDYAGFKKLIKFGFLLDGSTAALGFAVAACLAIPVGKLLHWPAEIGLLASAYSIIILFRLMGVTTAILRLFDQFKLHSMQQVITALLKLGGVGFAFIIKADLWVFVLVWALSEILGSLVLLGLAIYVLRENKIRDIAEESISGINKEYPGIWRFVWTTNIDGIVRFGRELDVLIVGRIFGVNAVGLYKVARQLAASIAKVVDPFYIAIYPDLSKLISKGNMREFVRLMISSAVMLGLPMVFVYLGFTIIGQQLILKVFGSAFAGAYGIALWCIAAMIIWSFAQPLSPAMLSLGKARTNYWIHLCTTSIYIGMIIYFSNITGIIGAGIAYFVFYGLWSVVMICALWHALSVYGSTAEVEAASA